MEQEKTSQDNSSVLLDLFEQMKELQIIKNFIRENTIVNKDRKVETGLFFGSELLNLIKYIDKDFYQELQRKAKQ